MTKNPTKLVPHNPKFSKKNTLSFHYSTRSKICQVLMAILAIFFTSTTSTTPVSALNTNNFYFDDFTADYYLSKDEEGVSHLKVVEKLTAIFPDYNQNHGITRVIPYTNNDGKNLTMKSRFHLDIAVERNGIAEKISKIENEDGYFTVYIGDADSYVRGRQVYTLTYEFENVILNFEEGSITWQELFWDTNGNDWSQKFNSLTARVHFTDDIKDSFSHRSACYVGTYGSKNTSRCETTELSDGLQFSATKLSARENLSFVLAFDADTFTVKERSFFWTAIVIVSVVVFIGLIIILLGFKVTSNNNSKRDYDKSLFIKPEYTPPSLTVAEAASIYLKKDATGNPMVATLLELATSHKITIIKSSEESATTSHDFMVVKSSGKSSSWNFRINDPDIKPEQAAVLKILAQQDFEIAKDLVIKPTSSLFASITGQLTVRKLNIDYYNAVENALVSEKMLEKSRIKSTSSSTGTVTHHFNGKLYGLIAAWIVLCIISFPLCLALLSDYGGNLEWPGDAVAIGLTAYDVVVLIILCTAYMRRTRYDLVTKKGIETSKYLEGLKLYIKMAEADRIKFLQSVKGADTSNDGIVKLYEKLLPYASLFGLEKSWLKELGHYYELTNAPTWYESNSAFHAAAFISSMNRMNSYTTSRFSHSGASSSSSSSSGFSSGGGFSGGGGGGGGGGGW